MLGCCCCFPKPSDFPQSYSLVAEAAQARHELTIGVVCSTRAPCQDIVGVCLHRSTAVSVLASDQPCRIDIGMSTFRDCNFGQRMDGGGAGQQEQVSGVGGSGPHGVRRWLSRRRRTVEGDSCSECLSGRIVFAGSAQSQGGVQQPVYTTAWWWCLGRISREEKDDDGECWRRGDDTWTAETTGYTKATRGQSMAPPGSAAGLEAPLRCSWQVAIHKVAGICERQARKGCGRLW